MSKQRKIYTVPAKFIFTGEFYIKADSQEQAEEYAYKHCGLVIGGNIHSSLPSDDVDWKFDAHPEKVIGDSDMEAKAVEAFKVSCPQYAYGGYCTSTYADGSQACLGECGVVDCQLMADFIAALKSK